MAKKVSLPAVDQAKVLIGDLDVRDLESVIQYSRFMLSQKKASEKSKGGTPCPSTNSASTGTEPSNSNEK